MNNQLPAHYPLDENDKRYTLRESLIKTLKAVPNYFTSPINIVDLDASDLFSFNTALGGAIEVATVDVLNNLRKTWDPNDEWYDYTFVRYPESFPDVRLVKGPINSEPAIGIELKGWYLLSREKQPAFRYKASASACSEWDLLVCYPWALSGVLSGSPKLYEPYIEQAKYAADMRNYYWRHRKGDSTKRNDNIALVTSKPYPPARSQYTDVPEKDSGNNFGRLARGQGPMTEWTAESLEIRLCGIEAKYWIEFFKAFKVSHEQEEISESVTKLAKNIAKAKKGKKKVVESELERYLKSFIQLQSTWPIEIEYK